MRISQARMKNAEHIESLESPKSPDFDVEVELVSRK